jgi:hypothetical protein
MKQPFNRAGEKEKEVWRLGVTTGQHRCPDHSRCRKKRRWMTEEGREGPKGVRTYS